MATNNDIALVTVGAGGPTVAFETSQITVTVVEAIDVGMVGVPIPEPFSVLEIQTPGVQGAKGVQNVFVGPTAPANPEEDWIWFKVP